MATKRKAFNEIVQNYAVFQKKARVEIEDQAFEDLFGEIGKSLAVLEKRVANVRDEKETSFQQLAAQIEQECSEDKIDTNYDRALGAVRESYLRRLREDLKALFDQLGGEFKAFLSLNGFAPSDTVRVIPRIPDYLVKEFMSQRLAKFAENVHSKVPQGFCGHLRWAHNLTSFQCAQWYTSRLMAPPLLAFGPKTCFTFGGRNVEVCLDPVQKNLRVTKCYLFKVVDSKGKVRSTAPFELAYDIFAPAAAPATFYAHGPHLLLVTSFAKLPTNLVYNKLKELDVHGHMPLTRPRGQFTASHFVLFDANFRRVREFMMCVPYQSQQQKFSIKVDFVNATGIAVSKLFHSSWGDGSVDFNSCTKRLLTVYSYQFKPVLSDLELPDSCNVASVLKIYANLIYYASYTTLGKTIVSLNVYDLNLESKVSSKPIPRSCHPYVHKTPKKILLDSKNNLYSVQRASHRHAYLGQNYYVNCVNVDTLEAIVVEQPINRAAFQGVYLDENDQLAIVSKLNPERKLVFNKFSI